MSNAVFGQGTLVKRGDGAGSEVFTTIAEVGTITGPSQRSEFIDVTSQDSVSGYREFVSGLIDPGEITFTANYIPANATHKNVLADFKNKTKHNWKIIFPTSPSTEWAFACTPTAAELTAPVDGQLQLNVTLKVSGAVTYPT
jgi:predicted secreted protein